ncbi:MAG: ABC transporter substrate-binding protein [Sulfobacillus acidophilus]|uniref:ABC transporter substrate-binding protein n=1 Tax=Sulfobacillus acidophilus TaxID=53633 RepID=A0A2T2WF66_9FIRM|nr:MAG: ABC transporter substrate-binding protein [Sulfobacillus acidophilus]
MTLQLHGITWDHTRGFTSVVACAQRYHEYHPAVDVVWEKRSLQAFADFSLEQLIDDYDLLVIDHPWIGEAARKGWLIALEASVSHGMLKDLQNQSVGHSYESYRYDGQQWALPIDAAAPVASWRPDLLEKSGLQRPRCWADLLHLAQHSRMILAAKPIDLLMDFYMLVAAMDSRWMQNNRVAADETIKTALEHLRELVSLCPPEVLAFNPIDVYEAMTGNDQFVYCPFAYGYVNYARTGYAKRRLAFGDIVRWDEKTPLASVLGGTGLAVSSRSVHVDEAIRFTEFVCSREVQIGLYAWAGGQPALKAVWEDDEWNRITGEYYRATRPALDRAVVRPRYPGYLAFQDAAATLVHDYVAHGGHAAKLAGEINRQYREASKGNAL